MHGRGYVSGMSGSGKSNWTKYVYTQVDETAALTVYVNFHRERVPGGRVVHTIPELVAAARAGHRKLDLHLPEAEVVGIEPVQAVVQQLWAWVKQAGQRAQKGGKDAPPWILVILDEAHRYAPLNGAYGPVEAFLCEGRKFGARVIVVSQRPQQVTTEAQEQADWYVFFVAKPGVEKYLEGRGIPYREFEAELEKPHHWVLVVRKHWTPYLPVPEV